MKIVRSTLVLALISSCLVLGLESQDPASPRKPQHPYDLPPVPAASADDIWSDDDIIVRHGEHDQTNTPSARDVKQTIVHSGDKNVVSSRNSQRSESLSSTENVIFDKNSAPGVAPDSSKVVDVEAPRSPKSVIRTDKSQKMAPTESRDQNTLSRETSDQETAQTSPLSQLSKREREQLLKNLEASFLNIVGLKSRPRPNSDVTVPQYMLELYKEHLRSNQGRQPSSRHSRHLHNSNTIRSFFHIEEEDKHPENVVRLKFDVTSFPGDEVLQAAELRLYREASDHSNQHHVVSSADSDGLLDELLREPHRIDVHQIIQPPNPSTGESALTRLIDTKVINPKLSNWESFDITPALAAWRMDENHGLEVRVAKASGAPSTLRHVRLKRSAKPLRQEGWSNDEVKEKDWEETKPLLVTYSRDAKDSSRKENKKDKRHKRNTDKKRDRRKRSKKERERRKKRKDRPRKVDRDYKRNCRRRELYVDFHDVGWTDWIVAPPGYNAFYCYGECPFHLADHFNTTNHAVVQQFVHSVDPQAVPKPCCVPTELGQVALLYVDEQNKVVLKNYKEMVVEACGCR